MRFYEEALRRNGIDYYLVGGHAFYAQQEIYDVLNLLRALVSPADEVSLAGALRSQRRNQRDLYCTPVEYFAWTCVLD